MLGSPRVRLRGPTNLFLKLRTCDSSLASALAICASLTSILEWTFSGMISVFKGCDGMSFGDAKLVIRN